MKHAIDMREQWHPPGSNPFQLQTFRKGGGIEDVFLPLNNAACENPGKYKSYVILSTRNKQFFSFI